MYCNIKILYLKKNIMISHPVYNHLNIKYKKYTHIYNIQITIFTLHSFPFGHSLLDRGGLGDTWVLFLDMRRYHPDIVPH